MENSLENEQNIYKLANESFNNREKPLPKYYEMDSRVRYYVKNGDYLGKIANKFGVRVSEIKKVERIEIRPFKNWSTFNSLSKIVLI